jgi:hypothetical protein
MDKKDVFQWMLDNKYLYEVKGVFKVTNKFLRDSPTQSNLPSEIPKMSSLQIINPVAESDGSLFKQFMEDAEIPFRVETQDGGQYTVKSTSKEAIKAFGKILRRIEKKEIDYRGLVMCTKLYYDNDKLYRQTILNYLTKGTWEFEYNQFVNKLKNGKIEQHIREQLGGSSFGQDI